MKARKNNSQKLTVVLLSIILVLCCTIGGTLAWLTASTGTVTNTFTVGNINIDLKEHELGDNGELAQEEVLSEDEYKVLPGIKQPKDPFVRVKVGSEACYVFVQVQEVNNKVGNTANKYVGWSIADGWTQLGTTEDGISTYWREQDALTAEDAQEAILYVLDGDDDYANGVVTYAATLTKTDIDALDTNNDDVFANGEKPKLIFKAFAVQKEAEGDKTDADGAAEAWKQIPVADRLPD